MNGDASPNYKSLVCHLKLALKTRKLFLVGAKEQLFLGVTEPGREAHIIQNNVTNSQAKRVN